MWSAIGRGWGRLPVVLRAVGVALVILAVGQVPGTLALLLNLRFAPRVPVFVLVAGAWLWWYFRYLDGWGWPQASAERRRQDLRGARLPGSVWLWSLVAGGLGLASVMSLALLTPRVADLPASAYDPPFDLSSYPWWTVVAFFATIAGTAGVVEEAAFRGYLLSRVERRHGCLAAIGVAGLLFYACHLGHAYATVAFIPFFAAYSILHGLLVYLTRSILPSILLHAVGDGIILPMQYGAVTPPFGPGVAPYLILWLAFGVAAVPAFRRLARLTAGARRPVATAPPAMDS